MKKKKLIPSQYQGRTLSNIMTMAAGIGMLMFGYYFKQIWGFLTTILNCMLPVLLGGALAFIIMPIVRGMEKLFNRFLFRKWQHPKLSRAIAAALSLVALLVCVIIFLNILMPQLVSSITQLVSSITVLVNNNIGSVSKLLEQVEWLSFLQTDGDELVVAWGELANTITNYTSQIMSNVMNISSKILGVVVNVFVSVIVAFYTLMDRERLSAQAKKIAYAILDKEPCEHLIYWSRRANKIFAGFISGKLIDSLIMGVLCYLCMLIFRFDYAMLISVVVGITNIIPFFGPFIGAVPSILILLMVDPIQAVWFALMILVLQQLDGNVIGPLILGDSVGVSALWITVAVMIGGGMFGFVGMLLSVPLFALLYAIVKTLVEVRLKSQGMPTRTADYVNLPGEITEEYVNAMMAANRAAAEVEEAEEEAAETVQEDVIPPVQEMEKPVEKPAAAPKKPSFRKPQKK